MFKVYSFIIIALFLLIFVVPNRLSAGQRSNYGPNLKVIQGRFMAFYPSELGSSLHDLDCDCRLD